MATSDANGNIAAVTSPFRALAAKFSYDAFGRTTSQSGPKSGIDLHALNYRFSTKPMELELATSNTTLVPPPVSSGLYYYGYRFYSPNLGRWISRDPIREQGGRNLYNFVGNDGVDKWDKLGMFDIIRINIPYKRTNNPSNKASGLVNIWYKQTLKPSGQCCAEISKIEWWIVMNIAPYTKNISDEEFIEKYESGINMSLYDRYENIGNLSYDGLMLHEHVHVKQIERQIDKIRRIFEKYKVSICFENQKVRDNYIKDNKEYQLKYFSEDEGKFFESEATRDEWEFYKTYYEKIKK